MWMKLVACSVLVGGSVASANEVSAQLSGYTPGVGASYTWGEYDRGAFRASGQLVTLLPLVGVEGQLAFLKSFSSGSSWYWGLGAAVGRGGVLGVVGGDTSMTYLSTQTFVGARSHSDTELNWFGEGGLGMHTALGQGGNIYLPTPYIKVGVTWPLR